MAVAGPVGQVSRLPLVVVGVVAAMAVVLTLILVAVRGPATYDEGTPEAALQVYVEAGIDGDEDGLFAVLTDATRAACEDDFDRFWPSRGWVGGDVRVDLDQVDIDEDRATASISVRRSSADDPFSSSSWSTRERFSLLRVDGDWKVDRATWPIAVERCSQGGTI